MNYIELINQFWQTRRSKRITSLQMDVYFFLLQECNLRGWENPFEVSNGLICASIGISEPSLIDARNRLQQFGLLEFQAGKRNSQSPVYYLKDNLNNLSRNRATSLVTPLATSLVETELLPEPDINNTKLNKTKPEDPPTPVPGDPPVLELFEKTVEPPKPTAPKPVKPSFEKIDPPKNGIDPSVIREVVTRFNNLCTQLPKVEVISESRKKAIKARITDFSLEQVYEVIELTSKSKFLNGQNDRNWSASFDWIFGPQNFIKVLERNFNKDLNGFKISNQQPSAGSARAKGFSVSPEYLRGIVADLQSVGND